MVMKKRFIFDLDGTLLNGDYSLTNQYLLDELGESVTPFLENMSEYLAIYERNFKHYNDEELSRFLSCS